MFRLIKQKANKKMIIYNALDENLVKEKYYCKAKIAKSKI